MLFKKIYLLLIVLVTPFISFSQTINWHHWEQATFEKAIQQNKPIFLDVGTEWCTACNWMEEDTYTNKEVIELLNNNFICIKVDAELQPNVGAQYLEWGWPALIFMKPNGEQVLAIQGNKQPQNFIPIVNKVIADFKNNKLKPMELSSLNPVGEFSEMDDINKFVNTQMEEYYDEKNYGWGFRLKMGLYNHIEYAFWKASRDNDPTMLAKAINTLNQTLKITDSIWGGVYFGSYEQDWSEDMPEKRTEYQAGAIYNFSEAYLVTKDKKWLKEALLIDNYLTLFMRSKSGFYFNGQEELLIPNPTQISPAAYFALSDSERRKLGIPPIDKTIYTDINARVVKAYAKLYEATGNEKYLTTALKLLENIEEHALKSNGFFNQLITNENQKSRIREIPTSATEEDFLRTQVWMGAAYMQLFKTTADTKYVLKAKTLMEKMLTAFKDPENGGFYSSNAKGVVVNGVAVKNKPLMDNGIAAQVLIELHEITDEKQWRKEAETCLKGVGNKAFIKSSDRLIAEYALALEKFKKGNILYSVTLTDKKAKDTDFFNLVKSHYEASRIQLYDTKENYPKAATGTLYICTQNLCSQAIKPNDDLVKEIEKFSVKIYWKGK